jgi:hypothetical protein
VGGDGFHPSRAVTLKAEGLPQAVLDAREVLAVERAEHALDELLLHGEDVRDPRRASVVQTDGLPVLKRMIASPGFWAKRFRIQSDNTLRASSLLASHQQQPPRFIVLQARPHPVRPS